MDPNANANANASPWFTETAYNTNTGSSHGGAVPPMPSMPSGMGGGYSGGGGVPNRNMNTNAPRSGSGSGSGFRSGPGSHSGQPRMMQPRPMNMNMNMSMNMNSMHSVDTSAMQGPAPSGTIGSGASAQFQDPEEDDYESEPPLLEELGVNFEQIWRKTQSVLLPTKQINEHILDDADLAGPIAYCFLFGVCLLFAAKVHFGYIYGFGVLSCLFLYLLMNLLSPERSIDVYRVCSVLGYCLLPIIALSAINIFVRIQALGLVGFGLATMCVLWSTHTASRFFEKALYMAEQKYLVVYPIGLVYACFVMIAVF